MKILLVGVSRPLGGGTHSLEHMPDQMNALSQARRLLAPGGRVLIRVPAVSSDAIEHYHEN